MRGWGALNGNHDRVTWRRRRRRRENGRGKQLLPSQFPVQLLSAHTHILVFGCAAAAGVGGGGGARQPGQQKDAQWGEFEGGKLTASQNRITTPSATSSLNSLLFCFFPSPHLPGSKPSVSLEVTVTEALIARVGKPVSYIKLVRNFFFCFCKENWHVRHCSSDTFSRCFVYHPRLSIRRESILIIYIFFLKTVHSIMKFYFGEFVLLRNPPPPPQRLLLRGASEYLSGEAD